MVRYWGVRLGERGRYVQHGKRGKYIAIGWSKIGDLSWLSKSSGDTEELFQKLKTEYEKAFGGPPDFSPVKIGLVSGEIFRFAKEISIGDIALVPDPIKRTVLIGKVTGDYEFKEDWSDGCKYPHRREVEWIKTVRREELSQKIKNSLVWLTIVSLDPHASEIEAILSGIKVERVKFEGEISGEQLYSNIIDRIKSLSAREFEEFIAHLLDIIGFDAATPMKYVGDKGIDVMGTLDAGLTNVNLNVQVKKISSSIGIDEVQRIRGALGPDDHGAIVTTSRFTKQAQEEAQDNRKKTHYPY